jgi:hypothetical protein
LTRQRAEFGGEEAHGGEREFGAQADLAAAFVLEGVGLVADALAGARDEEFEALEGGGLDLEVAVGFGHGAQARLDEAALGHLVGAEVAGAAGPLDHGGGGRSRGGGDKGSSCR